MSTQLVKGAGYVLKGLHLIAQPGIRVFVVVPLLINALLFAGAIVYGAHLLEVLINSWLPAWAHWLQWFLWPLFVVLAAALIFLGFTVLANLIGAPFNSFLAEAVERRLTGKGPASESAWKTLPREIVTSVISEIRKLAYFALWAIPILVISLIPGAQVIAPFLWFVFGAWALALEYGDYPMGNHGIGFREQRSLLASRRLLTFGYGGGAMLLTMVPVLNFIAMPVAVAGATAMWVEQLSARRAAADPAADGGTAAAGTDFIA